MDGWVGGVGSRPSPTVGDGSRESFKEAGKATRLLGLVTQEEISKLVHSHPSPTIRNERRLAEHQSSCFLVKNVLSRGSLHLLYMSLCHRRMNEGEASLIYVITL